MTKRSHAILLSVILFSAGCKEGGLLGGDFRPDAIGLEGQITIVIDSSLWTGPVGQSLLDHVGGAIETLPAIEPRI